MWEHGASAYANGMCHCPTCTAGNTERQARLRAERYRITREQGLPDHVEHGKSAYANWGCRCPTCTAANTESCRERSVQRNAWRRARRQRKVRELP